MKIRSRTTRPVGVPTAYGERRAPPAGDETAPARGASDRVQISDRGVEIRHARSLALAAPDIREELVGEIVALIEQGEYQVSGADVVPKLVREHLALARW